jgi:flavin-dependent amine oxidoreductase
MFLYGYSLLDVIATPAKNADLLERTSVLGFLSSQPYTTQNVIDQHYRTLANAFACPSYLTAMRSYKAFIKYGARLPVPMMWLLAGNAQTHLFGPLVKYLQDTEKRLNYHGHGPKLQIKSLTFVRELTVERGRIVSLQAQKLAKSPSISSGPIIFEGPPESLQVGDNDVILAVPPKALQQLVNPHVLKLAPDLGNVSQLRTVPMASLDVYFKRELENVPGEITLLLDSKYALSFLNVSKLWPELLNKKETVLNVVASDIGILADYEDKAVIELLCKELRRYIAFEDDDVIEDRALLQSNLGEELFINQVGSWDFRPQTTCGVPNLFIAGDYCQTCIDVVAIEGAVISGLMAAEVVRQRRGNRGRPIKITEPTPYPEATAAMLKAWGAPLALAAKALSDADGVVRGGYRRVFPNG